MTFKNFAASASSPLYLAAACLLSCLLCSGCHHSGTPALSTIETPVLEESTVQKLGIEVQAIRLSAAGNMLDFRYRAVNPERTVILFDRQIKPYLIHEATDAKFMVPAPAKLGPMRNTSNKPVAGKIYFMMFVNPGHYVKTGDQVSIVFGDYRIEHLTVE